MFDVRLPSQEVVFETHDEFDFGETFFFGLAESFAFEFFLDETGVKVSYTIVKGSKFLESSLKSSWSEGLAWGYRCHVG